MTLRETLPKKKCLKGENIKGKGIVVPVRFLH